ncbi:MAG TPA: hypothetical protein VES39_01895, partial [Rhodospirillales bacterium]|nr:hypothetical protein [Rhodospirillales bacterium]
MLAVLAGTALLARRIDIAPAIVIVARFTWVYPATYLARLLSRRLRARDPTPSWRAVFVAGFTGVRGAVSLAAA